MNKTILKTLTPHIAALLLFIVVSFSYFPSVIEGKKLIAHDTQSWRCMAQEIIQYNESHAKPTLWTNSMFGGMPAYQISMKQPNNILQYVENVLTAFPRPVSNVFLYLIGFYILLLAFGVNPWLSIAGAAGFTFASYNFVIIAAGHNSKAITIAYMAPLIGAVFLAFKQKRLLGAILAAFFTSLAIRANHIQILYYTIFILLVFGVVELVYSIKNKDISSYLKTLGALAAAVIIAVGMNATTLLTTYEYSKYTMRGDSNGLTDPQNSQRGLNKDYITQWSYGIDETMTLLIPNFKGGASGSYLSADSETGKKLKELGAPNVEEIMSQQMWTTYWGTQPFTSGPVYIGAIIVFLFVLSLFIVNKRTKWWLVPVIIVTLMLSWGRNFMGLTEFFINYVPMYNKFRTVSMILVATGFAITLLAILALKELFDGKTDKKKLLNALKWSTIITGGICLIFALIPSLAGSFSAESDAKQFTGDYSFILNTLALDRKAMLRADAFRSLAFIILSAAVIWLYLSDKLKKNVAISLLGILIFVDLMPVAKRYLNDKNFERTTRIENLIKPTPADEMTMQDKSQYRVMDITVDPFNDATPAYFHKLIGGYHAAKLRRYQELIDFHIQKEIGWLFNTLSKPANQESVNKTLDSLGVLNMLNMKYIIYNKTAAPILNPSANGNAWFVKNIRVAENPNDEIKLLGEINTKNELVVDKSLVSQLPKTLTPDTAAKITLTNYEPNHLTYSFSSKTDQVAVFSEVYYDKGWKATVNGNEIPVVRVNYLLRALSLKAGNYNVEFKFDPQSYKIGNILALVSSILLIALLTGYFLLRNKSGFKKLDEVKD